MTAAQGQDPVARLHALMGAQDYAYGGPYGSWAQRWIPGVCKHEHVRCTHGDEIIARRGRRRVCMDCGRALRGDLPRECAFTGRPHLSSAYPS